MKKPSFIIGKKQIILTCMTLMLGVAVYVNYSLTKSDIEVDKAATANAEVSVMETEENQTEETAEDADAAKYGESEFVNGDATADYFAQARLEKMNNRDEAVQTLQTIMGGGDITEDEMVTKSM